MNVSGTPSQAIVFQDKRHDFAMLMTLSKTGPSIAIPFAEVAHEADDTDFSVAHTPAEPTPDPADQIVVHKFKGKYVVLYGWHKIDPKQTHFKARLVSSPLLKRARIEEVQPGAQQNDYFDRQPRQFEPRNNYGDSNRTPAYSDRSYQGNRPRWGGRDRTS